MNISDFDYSLPDEQIARYPTDVRSQSRLLALGRTSGCIGHHVFHELPSLLQPGDLLVCNDTRVIPARLFGHKATGGRIEIFVERVLDNHRVVAHVKGGRSLKPQSTVRVGDVDFEMMGRVDDLFELRCISDVPVSEVIDRLGDIPLPHYMSRAVEQSDHERYQTVFASAKGSVAAPTAGLHFDELILQKLRDKNIRIETVTLHIGAGTFAPVRTEDIRQHTMHSEYVHVPESVCQAVYEAKASGGRVIAVGTTAARSLETAAASGQLTPFSGDTTLFMYPGKQFHCIDALITNFHLPRSTLLMLVSAFAGRENVLRAYQTAIEQKYRFFSYGDAMFIA